MEHRHIKQELCPHCGASVECDLSGQLACSFVGDEIRIFSCGHVLVYDQEAGNIYSKEFCPYSVEQRKITDQMDKAAKDIYDFIDTLDVDQVWKNVIKAYVALQAGSRPRKRVQYY